MFLKKKLYYITHVVNCDIFSTKGYVMVYYNISCTRLYARFDLQSFYSYFIHDKHFKLIHKGGFYDA